MIRRTLAIVLLAVLFQGVTGCKEEGAAERAGKAVDEAAEDAQEALEDAKKKLAE